MDNEADTARTDNGMEHFGYRESLDRGIGKFGSFAAGVSYISILTGTFQLFYFGFGTAGPAYLWSWPMVLIGQLAVALCFMELAAKYPVAGSVYNWSKQLGSRIVSWSAGWLMLTASIVTLSAVVLALQLNLPRLWSGFQIVGDGSGHLRFRHQRGDPRYGPDPLHHGRQCARRAVDGKDQQRGRLYRADCRLLDCNHSGVSREARARSVFLGKRYGASGGFLGAFLMASLASGYVMYGFDTASSLGEETVEPRRTAPRAILRAILASFVIGGSILVFAILAAPNLGDPQIASSSGGLQYIVEQVMWGPLGKIFLICIVIAVTVCSLAVHTAAIRLTFAMARDNALPFGEKLARVNPKTQTPITPAIVIGVIAALILVVNIGQPKIFTVLTSIAVIMIYLAYLMVTGPSAAEASARALAPGRSRRGRLLHHGQVGIVGQCHCGTVGRRDGTQSGLAARSHLRHALVQHLGRVRLYGSDSRSRPVVVRTQGSPSHRHAGLSLRRMKLSRYALMAVLALPVQADAASAVPSAAVTPGNTAAPISAASQPSSAASPPAAAGAIRRAAKPCVSPTSAGPMSPPPPR